MTTKKERGSKPEGGSKDAKGDEFDFEQAIAAIRRAAEVLARPEAKETLEAIHEAVKAATAIQDTLKAVAVQDAVKAVAVQDAVKAVAVQDAVKAVAVQDAVKAVAAQDDPVAAVRAVLSEEVTRALEVIRDAAAAAASTMDPMPPRTPKK